MASVIAVTGVTIDRDVRKAMMPLPTTPMTRRTSRWVSRVEISPATICASCASAACCRSFIPPARVPSAPFGPSMTSRIFAARGIASVTRIWTGRFHCGVARISNNLAGSFWNSA